MLGSVYVCGRRPASGERYQLNIRYFGPIFRPIYSPDRTEVKKTPLVKRISYSTTVFLNIEIVELLSDTVS